MLRRRLLAAALVLALAPAMAQAGEAKKEGGKKEGAASGDTYIAVASLNTGIAKPMGGRTLLTVDVGLDIPDPALHDQAALVLPRLRAAYAEALQAYGAGMPPGAPPNADLIAQKLQQSTDKTLGKAGAKLLLGSIIVN